VDTEYEPLLPGIAFAGYRSFAEWQEIRLPTKVTVLAGINNSGKSNVLRFIQEVLPQTRTTDRAEAHRTRHAPRLYHRPDFRVGIPDTFVCID
jgi:recombinational DNA repair ATPase RecF